MIQANRRRIAVVAGLAAVSATAIAVAGVAVTRLGAAPTALGPPRFVDETTAAGIDQTYEGGESIFVGGGVAVFDCNADGKPDLYLAGGQNPAVLERNDGPVGGALRFTAVHGVATDMTRVDGAYPLDIDGDGLVDLAVLRVGETVLLRGLGDCRFEPANETWQFPALDGYATAFSATWEGAAQRPTLAIGNYLTLDASGQPTGDCADNALVRPDASGPGYGPAFRLSPGYCALSMLFSDWDRSGRRDLRISNDRHYYDATNGEEQLWRIAPGEPPRLYTAADGWVQVQIEGMGIASYDLTNDGYPEVFLTSQGANKLQTLTSGPSQPTYRDIGAKRGVEATYPFAGDEVLPSTAWHPQFEDVNNDGFVDLFISKGNVGEQPDYARRDPSNLLLGQPDGTFKEAADAAGILSFDRGRGAALADFNLDGLPDLIEVNLGAKTKLWRSVGSAKTGADDHAVEMGHWLGIRATQPGPNHNAIGAWLEVKVGDVTSRRELTSGGGHVGGQLGWVHFGLGAAVDASVRVIWPDGQEGAWLHATADSFGVIDRAAGTLRPWLPAGG